MSVKRFGLGRRIDAATGLYVPSEDPTGNLVLHFDYAELEKDRDRLRTWVDELKARLVSEEEQHAYCKEFLELAKQDRDALRKRAEFLADSLDKCSELEKDRDELRAALRAAISHDLEPAYAALLRLGDLEKAADGYRWVER